MKTTQKPMENGEDLTSRASREFSGRTVTFRRVFPPIFSGRGPGRLFCRVYVDGHWRNAKYSKYAYIGRHFY